MKFDVILPTISRPSLRDAIDSVIAQDHKDWKLFIYEQGSKADLENYYKDNRHPFSYWWDSKVHNDYGAWARNAMIHYGQSEWIVYIDDDDIWLPDHLTMLEKIATLHPEANMIRTSGRSYTWKHKSPRSSQLVRKLGAYNYTDVLTVGMAHTRKLFKQTQGWKPCDNHDKLLWQEMLACGGIPVISDAVTFQFER